MDGMLESSEAAKRLGVKLSTLYVYVSRGLIESHASADGRRSLFRVDDVERLANSRTGRRGQLRQSEVITSITQITDAGPSYRGVVATTLLGRHFSEVAELLWSSSRLPWRPQLLAIPEDCSILDRCRLGLVLGARSEPLRRDHARDSVVAVASNLIASLAANLATHPIPTRGPEDVASAIARAMRPDGDQAALSAAIDAALVLLVDHELATSTQAVRLAASTQADLGDALLAGLGVVVGTLHGGASQLVVRLLRQCDGAGTEATLSRELEHENRLPGFGGGVYSGVDPRFVALLPFVNDLASDVERDLLDQVVRVGAELDAGAPSIDLALGMLAWVAECDEEFATALFVIARVAGWTAHYLEALGEPSRRIRSRAVYAARG